MKEVHFHHLTLILGSSGIKSNLYQIQNFISAAKLNNPFCDSMDDFFKFRLMFLISMSYIVTIRPFTMFLFDFEFKDEVKMEFRNYSENTFVIVIYVPEELLILKKELEYFLI